MLEIVPYLGGQSVKVEAVTVDISPADRQRVAALVQWLAEVTSVHDEPSFERATKLAGEAKGLLNEIQAGKRSAKRPFEAIGEKIDRAAADFGLEVAKEHQRILALLNDYVRKLEAERRAEETAKAEALRREREAYEAKIREARAAQREAELAARMAEDEAARLRLQQEALKNALLAEQEQLAREMAEELQRLDEEPRRGLVPGGRVDHPYSFRLVDVAALINNHRLDLLRWELNIRACQDAVKLQLERNPKVTPTLPGIEITQQISVSVKARKS